MVVLNSTRSGHTGIVKGLSWDPIGKFLASQSADRTVKIWAIDGWQCVKTIVEPFVESSPTTMFCRMDWSPDGTYLVLPCATNNEGPTAQLVRRKDWSMSLDLVGHRKAVTVIRACPRLLHYTTHKTDSLQGTQLKVTCFAVGSRDKALSVWLIPHIDRPIVVLNRLFKHSILDFSWNGLHLTICSMDGSVKSILFNANEVGRLMSDLEMVISFALFRRLPQYSTATNLAMTTKMNGDDVGTFLKRGTRDGNLPLGYELEMMKAKMDAEKRRNEEESKRRESLMRNRFEAHENAVTNGISAPSTTDSPKTNQLNEEVISSKDQAPVRAIVRPQSAAESPEIVSSQSASELNRPQQPVHNTEQKEVRTKSGKRRIQPVFVASLMAPEEDSSTVSNIQQQLNRSARPYALSTSHPLSFQSSQL
ncbi:unnamed protein product [Anisakis simplex]|uniref:Protein HIRA homolog (inferred by orthology to a C. elegans protein) n=1 Tax=Anisakis simplex TaxID=6269 RepID=A0A0M3KD51_ANISI|nr:unnamed protein product [Anisakis simplex]